MPTTVKLLSTYNGFKPGDIIVVEDAIAAQLLPFNATTNLTGGTATSQNAPTPAFPSNQTISAGQNATVPVPAGVTLSLNGSPDVAGTREVLNADGTVFSSEAILPGNDVIGVFVVDTQIRFTVTFGTLTTKAGSTLGGVEDAPLYTSSATLAAGEVQDRDYQKTLNAASGGRGVPSGANDALLGTVGGAGDYLKRINYSTKAAGSSQVVARDGLVAPVLAINTHATTASTTTVINTAINPTAVTANQFRDCLVKVGTEYRHIEPHAAFAAGVVNAFTVDRAFSVAPGVGVAVAILDRNFAFEAVPHGLAAGASGFVDIDRACRNNAWYVATADGVRLPSVTGDFT